MPEAKVFISRALTVPPESVLGPWGFRQNELDRALSRAELIAGLKGCRGLLSMLTDPIDEALLQACPELKFVAQHAVGLDNVDLEACARHGVQVCHTPGVLTEATADLAMALTLALGRRLLEGDRYLRAGLFKGWSPTLLVGRSLGEQTVGVLGYGRIGRAYAQRARAFGAKVIFHNRGPVEDSPDEAVSLDDLLRRSDILSLHLPLHVESHHLLSAARLAMLPRGALLINTARGPICDEAALVEALDSGQLGGAALDVYEHEPAVHPGLLAREDVILLPHLGSADRRTRDRMARMALADLRSCLEGNSPKHPAPAPRG